jgi:hypothetical protein
LGNKELESGTIHYVNEHYDEGEFISAIGGNQKL